MHYLPHCSVGRLILSGDDRAKFLHNFCTADIKRMQVGDIREAFVLNVKGKMLGLIHVLCRESSLELISWPSQTAALHAHLDRYLIREKVQFHTADRSDAIFLFGEAAEPALVASLPRLGRFQVCPSKAGEQIVAGGDFCGPGWLCLPADPLEPQGIAQPEVIGSFGNAVELAAELELEWWRISHGIPRFGTDVNEETLPQELQRDAQAISFDKGCYLGQETVARIDALGHVNRLVVRVQLDGSPLPVLPAELQFEGNLAGSLTSCTLRDGKSVGLATVKRALGKSGSRLTCGQVQVVVL